MDGFAKVLSVMWWRVFATWFVVVSAVVVLFGVTRRAWPAATRRLGHALLALTVMFVAVEVVLARW
jgi:hypothetical protein